MTQHEELKKYGREPLVDAITRFLAHEHASDMGEIRASLERAIDDTRTARSTASAGGWQALVPTGAAARRDPLARTFTVFSPTVSCSTRFFWAGACGSCG